MIYLRLGQIGGNSVAIQCGQESIAMFFLWATRIEMLNEPQQSDCQSDTSRFIGLWDRIHPTLAAISLDALLSYVNVDHGRVTEYPGSEQGARAASLCLLRALSDVDPTSTVLKDIRERYVAVIPPNADFERLLCYHATNAIHTILVSGQYKRTIPWMNYKPHTQEYIFFANTLVRVACRWEWWWGVPRWALCFVTHSLSQYPPSPASVIIDCLKIIAISLQYGMSGGDVKNLDNRCESLVQLHSLSR